MLGSAESEKVMLISRKIFYKNSNLYDHDTSTSGPSRGGGVFPGPTTFGGPHRRSKIPKTVFQMASFLPEICINPLSAGAPP